MSYRKWLWMIAISIWGLSQGITVSAKEALYQDTVMEAQGFRQPGKITDGKRDTYSGSSEEGVVTVSRQDGIGSLYIEFDRIPEKWMLTNPVSGKSITCGENGFLHEYVDVIAAFGETPETLVLNFSKNTSITDVYAFSEGILPQWVQTWNAPCEETDLMLLSSHSDDEQLFFAGILPYYTIERKLNVQVVYVVQHFEANNVENHQRPHELLDGLWTVGVRNYPIMSEFPDLYAESKDRQTALKQAIGVFEGAGYTYDDFLSYFTEALRRCKPLVVVSHDLDGEYGHGTHVLCASALTEAIGYAADESKFAESAEKYGTWAVEKTYLHLYEENPIIMDFDIPLESMGGKTAFQVSQDGFGCHKSQHWTWFYKWIYGTPENPITRAADITKYSPCLYGLYDTKVGPDTVGGDFMENIQTYEERALEAQRKAEEERLAREAAEAKEEQERLAQQKAREELEQKELLEKQQKENAKRLLVTIIIFIGIALSGCAAWIANKKRNGHGR